MRLAKYLAHAGIASRRAAERLIAEGRVSVAGTVVRDPARDVDEASGVAVDGKAFSAAQERVVYALNKPVGVLSTARDPQGRTTVLDLIGDPRRLYPVGRLDADSSGLILLTNDGELAHRLTHPSFEVPKTYRVRVRGGPLGAAALGALRAGVRLEDGPSAPAKARRIGPDEMEITIREGRNRQVRRMCDAVGHPAQSLTRVRFGALELGDLAPGAHRRLSAAELRGLTGDR
ncbi:MAG: pseudouridine synthase [Solirubrobacteraceae bacterium]